MFRTSNSGSSSAVRVAEASVMKSNHQTLRGTSVVAILLALAVALCLSIAPGHTQNEPVVAYAFAKASPLQVSDNPALTGGRFEPFEFGTAYEVTEQKSEYVKFRRPDGSAGYVRPAHVSVVGYARWLATTGGFGTSERARIRFWESSTKLGDLLSGSKPLTSQFDYQEFFDDAPHFPVALPIMESDTIDLLNGTRQVRIASVLIPISKEMVEAFEKAKGGADKPLDLHFLLDVSGSTREFLETAMLGLAKAVARNEALRKKLHGAYVTTFAASLKGKSVPMGSVPLPSLERASWHGSGTDQPTEGDREPLLDGLLTLASGIKPSDAAMPVLVVLSGADVDLAGEVAKLGKPVSIDNLPLKLPSDTAAIFAQVTPEPGDDLRNASRRLQGLEKAPRYLEFSDSLGTELAAELVKLGEAQKGEALRPEAFAGLTKAAYAKQMIPFLPRVLTRDTGLPARQNYAANADWYTVRLWLPIDELIWKETTR
jgi:hypothetical protein